MVDRLVAAVVGALAVAAEVIIVVVVITPDVTIVSEFSLVFLTAIKKI